MDNVLVDFQSELDKIDEETKNQYRAKWPGDKDHLDEIPGLFGKMDTMPRDIRTTERLMGWLSGIGLIIPVSGQQSASSSASALGTTKSWTQYAKI